jgi:UDP-N-acetylmuramyl pentapeptide phosphotransferase/UDP-N-acetylglucosamine-1-phosphate transferase
LSVLLPFLTAFALSWALTGLLVRLLSDPAHKQLANQRSMHTQPTPVGGGLAIVAAFAAIVLAVRGAVSADVYAMLGGAVFLSLVSATDHYRPLWPATRLAAQALVVAVALAAVPDATRFLPTLPWWWERLGLALAWLWLINLTNFMDGIDGIASAEGAAVALGVAALFGLRLDAGGDATEVAVAVTLAGACLGFLVWNWAPARIFMGDAGSVPLGFLMGWLLLQLAIAGFWAAAIVLPLLFVADATCTLLRRMLSGKRLLQPHRTHFYQRAVLGGASAPEVVGFLTACNVALVLLTMHARERPLSVLAAGVFVAAIFLIILAKRAPPNNR